MTMMSMGPVAGCSFNPTSWSAVKIEGASSDGVVATPFTKWAGWADQLSVKLYEPVRPVLSTTGRPTPANGPDRTRASDFMDCPCATVMSPVKNMPVSGLPSLSLCRLSLVSVAASRSEGHTSELQSRQYLVCRLLL